MPRSTIKKVRGEPGFGAFLTLVVSVWILFYGTLFAGMILGIIWLANHI